MNSKAIKRQLLAAIAMVLVAAIALGSSTYAWFVQSNTVTAEGMEVQAQAEGGIEITNAGKGTWASTAQAAITGVTKLYPASTQDTSVWYHAQALASTAKDADTNSYKQLTLDDTGKATAEDEFKDKQFYLVNKFSIRATAGTSAKNLMIDSVTVTPTGTNTTNLDRSLRIAVKAGENTYVFAPTSENLTYNVWNGTDLAKQVSANRGDTQVPTGVTTISSTGTDVLIYIWYEGEDAQHFSNNLQPKVDTLSVTVQFSATTGEAAV